LQAKTEVLNGIHPKVNIFIEGTRVGTVYGKKRKVCIKRIEDISLIFENIVISKKVFFTL